MVVIATVWMRTQGGCQNLDDLEQFKSILQMVISYHADKIDHSTGNQIHVHYPMPVN